MTIDVRPATAADLPALAFYARLGARPWDEVVSPRLDGAALARLADAGD